MFSHMQKSCFLMTRLICITCFLCVFQIEAADIGRIQKIRIGHDGTGMFSGWFLEKVVYTYRPPALSQTRLSRKPHLCRIDPSLPSVSPYMLLYFNLACVEHGYDENSAVLKC